MNLATMSGSPLDSRGAAAATLPWTRQLYWSLRRELWENRSIYIAPLIVGAVFLFGFLVSMAFLPDKMRAASGLDPAKQHELLATPYVMASALMMLTTLVVGVFYCLDALYGERRDRSILFWKSLPVSDLVTVLSKAITPVIILPLVAFVITAALQWIMLLLSTLVLVGSGLGVPTLWTHAALFQVWVTEFYHLITVHGFWYAPIYGWLLLMSSWARRTPFLWAVLPPLTIAVVEKIAFNTTHFATMLLNRLGLGGGEGDGFMAGAMSMYPLMHFSPARVLIDPGLWVGVALCAVFLAIAVRLRRRQAPI
jgi:ABC-2 type transport system permease protein